MQYLQQISELPVDLFGVLDFLPQPLDFRVAVAVVPSASFLLLRLRSGERFYFLEAPQSIRGDQAFGAELIGDAAFCRRLHRRSLPLFSPIKLTEAVTKTSAAALLSVHASL